jgi:hypothetical protein
MKKRTVREELSMPTKVIIGGLFSIVDDMEDSGEFEEEIWLLESAAARFMTLIRIQNFILSGFIGTNLVWITNALGYL